MDGTASSGMFSMLRLISLCVVALVLSAAFCGTAAARQIDAPLLHLTYNSGSSVKLEQIAGDCDWVVWDATIVVDSSNNITSPNPACEPTLSQTITRFDVLGHDLGSNFEHNGQIIFLFGDTIGATRIVPQGVVYES